MRRSCGTWTVWKGYLFNPSTYLHHIASVCFFLDYLRLHTHILLGVLFILCSESHIGDKDSIREARSPGLGLDNDRELLGLDGKFDEDQMGREGHSEGGRGYMTLETLAKRMDKVIGNIVGLSERDPFSVDALNKRRARMRLNSRSEHEYEGCLLSVFPFYSS